MSTTPTDRTELGLTDEDREKLGRLAETGAHAWGINGDPADPDPDDGKQLEGQDGRGLTIEQCNAIRAAAEDGKTYREIADLFAFLETPTAYRHAVGDCSHGAVDYPPVPSQRDPGPVNAVDDQECRELREHYAEGVTVNDLADETGRSLSTVYRHVGRNCSHGRMAD